MEKQLICVFVFRYIFLFDKVVIVCKRKGYSYELKEIIELQSYKMSDDPMNNRDMKKVRIALERTKLNNMYADVVTSRVITTNVALELKDFVDGNLQVYIL